jgi:aspartate racemase
MTRQNANANQRNTERPSATAAPSKIVGILGGMGPAATVDLMQRIIASTPANDDADHIHMLVDNNPKVPSRIKALIEKTGPSPLPVLEAMARRLESQGADFLAMPCNTAHHFYPELASAVEIPVLNIMQLAVAHIAAQQPAVRRVGMLASSALSQIALYEPWMASIGADILYPKPEAQEALMSLIVAVKSNRDAALGHSALWHCADELEAAGAECLLIACTELSVIARSMRSKLPHYDAADILARAVIDKALGQSPAPRPTR